MLKGTRLTMRPRTNHLGRPLRLLCRAQAVDRVSALRSLLARPGIIKGPCCHDALSAKLIEQAGFDFAFMSGFCTAASRIGAPDTGLISYGEMVDVGRLCNAATSKLPIIGDGDTGYGNALNVQRTVRGYADAGFAGILIEDQVAPKSCGHVRGKRVCSREEAVMRIRAAAQARDQHKDICIVARTDARQAVSLEEALWRVEAFAEAGADILFIDALASEEEMLAFCRVGGAARSLPKMANMLEGGGKTPILAPEQLEAMGFKLVAYPLSLLGVSVKAMQDALGELQAGRIPQAMPDFKDLQRIIGFDEYFAKSDEFAISLEGTLPLLPDGYEIVIRKKGAGDGTINIPNPVAAVQETAANAVAAAAAAAATATWTAETMSREAAIAAEAAARDAVGAATDMADAVSRMAEDINYQFKETGSADKPEVLPSESIRSRPPPRNKYWREEIGVPSSKQQQQQPESSSPIEPEVILEEEWRSGSSGPLIPSSVSVEVQGSQDEDPFQRTGGRDRGRTSGGARVLRIKVFNRGTGEVKIETRIPAGFLEGIAAFIPEVRGVDLEGLVSQATGQSNRDSARPIFEFDVEADKVQIFLE